jgi:cellulose synthase/poly-beta-1,6-N-acetylglucosamine synthase-like glycosyltransferase
MDRTVLDIGLLAGAIALAPPILLFAIECAAALWPRRADRGAPPAGPDRVAVIIPAHDEEACVEAAIRSVRPQLRAGDRLIVVADNCTDGTADRARLGGATVVERREPSRLGKGYAMSFGLEALRADPPDVVIFVDADSTLTAGSVDALRRIAAATRRPAQAVYLVAPDGPHIGHRAVSSFALLVKNWVRPLGLDRLGVPCLLTGTGMAIPWDLLQGVPLADAHLVEDMQLGIRLAALGAPARLCPEARALSAPPPTDAALKTQRRRWEHGHILMMLSQVPRLALHALRRWRPPLLLLSLDLMIPPLSLLFLLWGLIALASIVRGVSGGVWLAGLLAGLEGALMAIAVLAAWGRFARRYVPFRALLFALPYALWKIPLYVTFLFRRQSAWVRTPREPLPKPLPKTSI